MGTFHRKVVLITGAAGGIGSVVAHTFASEGASLALIDFNEPSLRALAQSLQDKGTVVHTALADLSTEKGVRNGIEEVLTPFENQIDVLIANVGKLISNRCEQLIAEQWKTAFDINFFSHVYACQSVIPLMMKRGGGCIVFTGSDQGLQPDEGLAPYAPAKAATHSLAKILSRELAPHGIWVNAVAPGMTRTPLVEVLMEQRAQEFGTDRKTAEKLELERRRVPLARLGEPEEVARVIVFLAKEPFSNGAIWDFSGGNVRSVTS